MFKWLKKRLAPKDSFKNGDYLFSGTVMWPTINGTAYYYSAPLTVKQSSDSGRVYQGWEAQSVAAEESEAVDCNNSPIIVK